MDKYTISFENAPSGASVEFLHYNAEIDIGTLVIKTNDGGENFRYCSKEQAKKILENVK